MKSLILILIFLLQSASALSDTRISLGYFDRPLQVDLQVLTTGEQPASSTRSPVQWKDLPPSAAAPQGQYLADFRDHIGCAQFQSIEGVQLCFQIMGDVSNLGLNDREMKLEGLNAFLNRDTSKILPAECLDAFGAPELVSAQRARRNFEMKFIVRRSVQNPRGCPLSAITVLLNFQQTTL